MSIETEKPNEHFDRDWLVFNVDMLAFGIM